MVTCFLKLSCCIVLFFVSLILLQMAINLSYNPLIIFSVFSLNFILLSLYSFSEYQNNKTALKIKYQVKKLKQYTKKAANIAA